MYIFEKARGGGPAPSDLLRLRFGGKADGVSDAIFLTARQDAALGVRGLPFHAPAVNALLLDEKAERFLARICGEGVSVLISYGDKITVDTSGGACSAMVSVPGDVEAAMLGILDGVSRWPGVYGGDGEHAVDLRAPDCGPHFSVNLLLGNRVGFPCALQTTPKSVVDKFGGGSFRSHAATQVLATRWDMRQEENGFPCNRQFYILENGRQIFYSRDVWDANVKSAVCTHSQNVTSIEYETRCGLKIKRTIFLLPQREGLPLAVESQRIEIENLTGISRELRLVAVGMFGSAVPNAVFEDVLYSNIVMQSGVLRDEQGRVAALSPDYRRDINRRDIRFHSSFVRGEDGIVYPREFCMNLGEFLAGGTLERPRGVFRLSCKLYRKGPGFFAVAHEFKLARRAVADNFTGLVSSKCNGRFSEQSFPEEVEALLGAYADEARLTEELEGVRASCKKFASFLSVRSRDQNFDSYVNNNLPFQVFYQTFVSRSFCQTQKGYREIGFREIQDLFASMAYFCSAGLETFVKELIKQWGANVYRFGYTNHNFYWEGKEAGQWSDDGLWFAQCAARYVQMTGDTAFLDERCAVAGEAGETRSVLDTVMAVFAYSGEVSVGKHGLPLLDRADWNDCLRLDADFVTGAGKESVYREKGCFPNEFAESVMNGFLLKYAADGIIAALGGQNACARELKRLSAKLYDTLQQNAWKNNFFARVLLNRPALPYTYLGAGGDGLSTDPDADGVYFINSFSWSVLSGVATEAQIAAMLGAIEKYLKTPYGIKLMSPAALHKISPNTASDEYFAGDRENGGVFKHACMMATAAMFKAAKEAKDTELAEKLAETAYWMIDLVLPYKTMDHPYDACGNPRFCTQYNNSETGENIGPMLSGTSGWLALTLFSAFGFEKTGNKLVLNPILRVKDTALDYTLTYGDAVYDVSIRKPLGFRRAAEPFVYDFAPGRHTIGIALD